MLGPVNWQPLATAHAPSDSAGLSQGYPTTTVRTETIAGFALFSLWSGIHLAFFGRFIFHDSWQHIFPIAFRIWNSVDGLRLPLWLGSVDTGSPSIIYTTPASLLQIVRIPELYLGSLLRPNVEGGLYLHKAEIFVSYAIFCWGTYILGRALYTQRLSAIYLAVATLFAGITLDASHSDQIVSILFWIPWAMACGVLFHQSRSSPEGARYLNFGVVFLAIAALDQYPHFPALVAAIGVVVYASLHPRSCLGFLRMYGWRLWPGVVVLVVLVFQLVVLRDSIGGYRPGLRADTVVDPATMGVTGFVQPSTFIGSVFPLSFFATFEALDGQVTGQLGRSIFIFKLDALVFGVGLIPLALAAAWLTSRAAWRVRLGWALVGVAVLLVSLQDSRLYFLLFRLPFFDLFRSYFLYSVYVVVIILVMSGYGMDRCLVSDAAIRRRLLLRAGTALGGFIFIAAACLVSMVSGSFLLTQATVEWPYVAADLGTIAVSALALVRATMIRDRIGAGYVLMIALALCQSVYLIGVYADASIGTAEVLARQGLASPEPAMPTATTDATAQLERNECQVFAACYLSSTHTASLRQDLNSPLWRSADSPLLQPGLDRRVAAVLLGINHPVFWLSQRAASYATRDELVTTLNAHASDIDQFIASQVQVSAADAALLGTGELPGGDINGTLEMLEIRVDRVRLIYNGEGPAVLNAAITFDSSWSARVDGHSVPIVRGNFDGLAVALPAGSATVELTYSSWPMEAFFGTRALLLAKGIGAAWRVWRIVRRRTVEDYGSQMKRG